MRQREPAYIGIMVCPTPGPIPFLHRGFMRQLSMVSQRLGICTYVFAIDWIHWSQRKVKGFIYEPDTGRWLQRYFPLPRLIYDRAFFHRHAERLRHRTQIKRLLQIPGVRLLGLGLSGKWEVHQILSSHATLKQLLPRTERYRGVRTLRDWFDHTHEFILKPNCGTHGKGVFRLRRISRHLYELNGRSRDNMPIRRSFRNIEALFSAVHDRLVRGQSYLIQQYISLQSTSGHPFDIRSLVQKDGQGEWRVTGTAARIGPSGSITSNLHGGGIANETKTFLNAEYDVTTAEQVFQSIHSLSLAIARTIEQGHGPLLELGLDFGVDPSGRVWLLEANSRPGRSSFLRMGNRQVRTAAIANPMRYARYALNQQ
jgi:glutathione synthase/RimK-type ligase-like ATP-grasp enzyme